MAFEGLEKEVDEEVEEESMAASYEKKGGTVVGEFSPFILTSSCFWQSSCPSCLDHFLSFLEK